MRLSLDELLRRSPEVCLGFLDPRGAKPSERKRRPPLAPWLRQPRPARDAADALECGGLAACSYERGKRNWTVTTPSVTAAPGSPGRAAPKNPCRMRGNLSTRSGPGYLRLTTWSVQPQPEYMPVARLLLAGRGGDEVDLGRESAHDGLLLQTFGTLSRRNLKAVTDQGHRFAHISGKSTHLQRQTGVTEADCTVRPEQDCELILNVLHGGLQTEEQGDLRLRHRGLDALRRQPVRPGCRQGRGYHRRGGPAREPRSSSQWNRISSVRLGR